MDTTNIPAIKPANPDQIEKAQRLLEKSGLYSPASRYLSEAIIKSKSEMAINSLTQMLTEYIQEKDTAYHTFKQKMDSIARDIVKDKLPAAA